MEPALALAAALVAAGDRVTLLGTAAGLESRLVPARGYPLALLPRVPLPRRLSPQLLTVPTRLLGAVRAAASILDREHAAVVVGFGGYVALPAYLAARRQRIPIVVHEANARAGLANRIGARLTPFVAAAVPAGGLPHAVVTGIPLRTSLVGLDRSAARDGARHQLGLRSTGPVLLITGGSQGARRINEAVVEAAPALAAAGVQVLHHAGVLHAEGIAARTARYPDHHVVAYIDRMDLAYAAADLAVSRAGALTCAEFAAVGLPAVYVPLPIGNGEQRRNAAPVVAAGGGLLIEDAAFDGAWVCANVLPLLHDATRLATMSQSAPGATVPDAAAALVSLVHEAAGGR